MVAISRSRHRPGCRNLHQGTAAVRIGHGHRNRSASEFGLEQSGAGNRARRRQPRPHAGRHLGQRCQPARLRRPQRALLGKAKDNNGSCAIGPFLRLFDGSFSIDDVRRATVDLRVEGTDGFVLRGTSSMDQITRDPLDLVAQAIGPTHQYPDGAMLFLGTLFAPTEDRDAAGAGFTHKQGDVVTISSRSLARWSTGSAAATTSSHGPSACAP